LRKLEKEYDTFTCSPLPMKLHYLPVSLTLIAVIILSACGQPEEPIVGGDRDEHGCIGSAGYSWCEPKQKCLRVWEEECYASDEEALHHTIADLIGKKLDEVAVTITKQAEGFARGNISFGPDAPGGMYLAVKSGFLWEIVYQGNGSVNCEELAERNFPKDLLTGLCD
jgi:hypothetical protein